MVGASTAIALWQSRRVDPSSEFSLDSAIKFFRGFRAALRPL